MYLCEKGDLGGGTSSASTKLIHGGLRYLEYYEFRLVREALMEREMLWRSRRTSSGRCASSCRITRACARPGCCGSACSSTIISAARKLLPPTRTLRPARRPAGAPLKPEYTLGFEYSDCWVEDSRLVVLNARDAADRGATIAPRTRLRLGARAKTGLWRLTCATRRRGETHGSPRARSSMPPGRGWARCCNGVVRRQAPRLGAPGQGQPHRGAERLFEHDRCYIFQNNDGRIFFVIPYEQDFTLIGTTDLDYRRRPRRGAASPRRSTISASRPAIISASPITPRSGGLDLFRRPPAV